MNRFLKSIFVIYFLIGVNSIAFSASAFKQHRGQGEVKISQGVFDILEFYLSGGKYGKLRNNPPEWAKSMLKSHWNPMFLIISKDGEQVHWYYDPHGDRADMNPNYLGKARVKCGKRGHGECFVFAERRKIVWQNGINPKKGTLIKKKQVQQGMLPQILKELGFYDGGATQTEKIEKKKKKKEKKTTKKSSDDNIVIKLKELKELFDSGALTEEEYKKAKEKLLN